MSDSSLMHPFRQEASLPAVDEPPQPTGELPNPSVQTVQTVRREMPSMHAHHAPGLLPALQSLMVVLIVALFFMTFTVQPIRIPSASMEPTLLVGDFLLMNRQAVSADGAWLMPPTGIEREDVVVFHDPIDNPNVHLVKRVIGLPGDRVRMARGKVYVNGSPLTEAYAVYRPAEPDAYRDDFPYLQTMDARVDAAWWIRMRHLVQDGELRVPPGNYFVLGDNRNDSDDSRYWGFVPRRYIVGKPVLVYFSWQQPDPLELTARKDFARWERILHVVR